MQAMEFVTKAHNGVVDLPHEFQDWNGKPVRSSCWKKLPGRKASARTRQLNVWAKTAWQGKHLAREPQDEYEKRRKLE